MSVPQLDYLTSLPYTLKNIICENLMPPSSPTDTQIKESGRNFLNLLKIDQEFHSFSLTQLQELKQLIRRLLEKKFFEKYTAHQEDYKFAYSS